MFGFLGSLFTGGGSAVFSFVKNYWQYLVLIAFVAAIYWYHQHLLGEIKSRDQTIISLEKDKTQLEANNLTLKSNIAELESTINDLNAAVKTLDKVRKQDQTKMLELAAESRQAREEVISLKNTFKKHDLGNLSLKKPGLIEGVINKGTKKVLDDLENLSDPTKLEVVK